MRHIPNLFRIFALQTNRDAFMIQSVPNPKMTADEVKSFRENLAKSVSRDIMPEELSKVRSRQRRMKENYKKIISNNGGKNPILGY